MSDSRKIHIGDESEHTLSRKAFLTRGAALGMVLSAGGLLAASCGGDTDQAEAGTSGVDSETGATQAAASGASAEPGSLGTLTVRDLTDIQNTDPAFTGTTADGGVSQAVMEGLVSYKPGTWEVVNVLAETFEASPDGLQYHFRLKEGIQFHGGYGDLTASDVKFSYERIAGLTEPKVASIYVSDWEALKEVTVTGPYEGTIVLKQPFAPLMRTTLPTERGFVISEKAVKELGDKFGTHPIGTGPYEFAGWTPGQEIRLRRFADYSGAWQPTIPPVAYENISILPITADSAAQNAFDAGDLDFTSVPYIAVDRYENRDDVVMEVKPTLDYKFLSMNVKDQYLSNADLRQAIRAAIDFDAIVIAATDGRATRANAIIPEAMGLGYWADAPVRTRDVDAATQLLVSSGVGDITLTLHVANFEEETAIAQVVEQNLEEIGIGVDIIVQEPAVFFDTPGQGAGGDARQLVVAYFVTQPDPSWSLVWFTCPQVGLFNYANWCDEQFQTLFDQANQELDEAARNTMYTQMQELWDEQCNTVWAYYPTGYYVSKPGLSPSLRPDGRPNYFAFRGV